MSTKEVTRQFSSYRKVVPFLMKFRPSSWEGTSAATKPFGGYSASPSMNDTLLLFTSVFTWKTDSDSIFSQGISSSGCRNLQKPP
jgi:hypothetical protein